AARKSATSPINSDLPPGITIQALQNTMKATPLLNARKIGAPKAGSTSCRNPSTIAIRMLASAGRVIVEKNVPTVIGEPFKLEHQLRALSNQVEHKSTRTTPLAPHRTPITMKRIMVALWRKVRPKNVFERPRVIRTNADEPTGCLINASRLKI